MQIDEPIDVNYISQIDEQVASEGDSSFSIGSTPSNITTPQQYEQANEIVANRGRIGGWIIESYVLTAANIRIDSAVPSISMGEATDYFTGTGIWMGLNESYYRLHIGNPSADYLKWDGTNLTVTGTIIATTATIASTLSDSFTINADATDANVDLVFSRTTGGDATLRWNGDTLNFDKTVTIGGVGIVLTSRTLTAGDGLTGGGDLSTNRSFALTTPGTLTVSSTNSASGSHTHAITSSSNPGAVASILASNASGYLQLVRLGVGVTPSYTLQSLSTTEQLRLNYDVDNYASFTVGVGGNLTIAPTGDIVFNPTGNDILPTTGYDLNIGSLGYKYLTLHAAELWVETLVAQNTIATIGGRILVGPTTSLVRDLAGTATTIYVKHNEMASGDIVYMEANGSVEFMAITSAASAESDGYSYTVTRGLEETRTLEDSYETAPSSVAVGGAQTYKKVFHTWTATNSTYLSEIELNLSKVLAPTGSVYIQVYAHGGTWGSSGVPTGSPLAISDAIDATTIGTSVGWISASFSGANRIQLSATTHYVLVLIHPSGGDATNYIKFHYHSGAGTHAGNVGNSPDGTSWSPSAASDGAFRVYTIASLNSWYAGDAVFNTGTTGDGFIDIYSVAGVKAGTEYGPAIAGNVRNSATYNDWSSHWAIGQLNGLYGYGVSTYGVAFGEYAASKTHITIDSTNGYRIFNGTSTVLGQWDASGNILIGNAATENTYITSTSVQFRDGSTVYTDLTAGVLTLGLVSGGEYITIDGTNGIKLYGGGNNTITIANSGNISLLGSLSVGTAGAIYSSQTAYETGTGYWLEYNGGTPRFSLGVGGSNTANLHWDGTNLIVNGSKISNQDIFGDGSDGNVTISSNTTLTADMYYNDLTVNNGVLLNSGGYRIFVKGTLTNNGTIHRNGNAGTDGTGGAAGSAGGAAGSAGTGGAALADGSVKGTAAGVDGKNGVAGVTFSNNGNSGIGGGSGTDVNKSLSPSNGNIGSDGGKGGNAVTGGTSTGGAKGSGGVAGVKTGTIYNTIKNATAAYLLYDFVPSGEQLKAAPINGGAGSGGSGACRRSSGTSAGNSGGSGGSGGSGSNGGIIAIFAKVIINNGTISANGGNGGHAGTAGTAYVQNAGGDLATGGTGGSGGGNGGNGGVLVMVYSTLTAGTETASGGTKGNKSTGSNGSAIGTASATNGDDGVDGSAGTTGVVIKLQV